MTEELEKAKRLRGSIIGLLTKQKNNFDDKRDQLTLAALNVMSNMIDDYYTRYTAASEKVLELATSQNELEAAEKKDAEFAESYVELKSQIMELIVEETPRKPSLNGSLNNSMSQRSVRLPKLELPKFSGNYHNWLDFKNEFSSMILEDQSLTDVDRFRYLKSSLTEAPRQIVANMEITAENFHTAWKALCDRYDNTSLIFRAHINQLLSLQGSSGSSEGCRALLDRAQSHYRSLLALGSFENVADNFMIANILSKLDSKAQSKWEESATTEIAKWTDFSSFLERYSSSLERIDQTRKQTSSAAAPARSNKPSSPKSGKNRQPSLLSIDPKCDYCKKKGHRINDCPEFQSLTPRQRYDQAKSLNLCIVCLNASNGKHSCKSRCAKCNQRHHSLLHFEPEPTPKPKANQPSTSNSSDDDPMKRFLYASQPDESVFLASALVFVRDNIGNYIPCNAILDSGSTDNYVTEHFIRLINAPRSNSNVSVGGIGDTVVKTKGYADISFTSQIYRGDYDIRASILPKITDSFPAVTVDIRNWNLPPKRELADPNFNIPKRIDLLIGGGLFWSLLTCAKRALGPDLPFLFSTELGFIVVGPHLSARQSKRGLISQSHVDSEPSLESLVKQFWQLDSFNDAELQLSPENQECEDYYSSNVYRESSGRYIVKLPLKSDPSVLGDSLSNARRRFLNLEKRLERQPDVKRLYSEFIQEYARLGHLQEIDIRSIYGPTYYLPHHCVVKPDSSSTKLRVVFDASCKTSTGLSLNDILHSGPKLQKDLVITLLRFRLPKFVVTADIQKMYRQVYMDESDSNLQLILWRDNPSEPIKTLRLTTVTYGTACGAYLAIKTLYQLAHDEGKDFPLGAKYLRECFYVDDAMIGSNDLEELRKGITQLRRLLERGCFNLSKFCSNSEYILDEIPAEHREKLLVIDDHDVIKALGMIYQPDADIFRFKSRISGDQSQCTKRSILSSIARLFDPLGLLCPVVTKAKIFFQALWQVRPKLDWDTALSGDFNDIWLKYEQSLESIKDITIPRHVLKSTDYRSIELHGFCDASEKAYGACVYVRVIHNDETVTVTLLVAKSKVAPVKTLTIARLELCGAVLLTDLIERLNAEVFHDVELDRVLYWTDSRIVLDWLNSPASRWQTFVAHRIARIQEKTQNSQWKHIAGSINPADLISRGAFASELINCDLWWNGPSFLGQLDAEFSEYAPTDDISQLPEYRSQKFTLLACKTDDLTSSMQFSTGYRGTRRAFVYVLRFIHRCRKPLYSKEQRKLFLGQISQIAKNSVPSVSQEEAAELTFIKILQQSHFSVEYGSLKEKQQIPSGSSIRKLTPFFDETTGLLRVGGRVRNANIPFNAKHQILLPRNHPFTKSLIVYFHRTKLFHAGPNTVLTSIRAKYWPMGGLQAVRAVISKCIWCFRLHPRMMNQIMGQLPTDRVDISNVKPFSVVGVDFAGPIRVRHHARCKQGKEVHLSLFICFITKAVHVELVPDRSTDSFLLALKRLISDRGTVRKIYSDNATNFRGAANYLRELKESLEADSSRIESECRSMEIEWSFIAPRTPHQGGLWEASIKLLKRVIKNITGACELTQDELTTVAKQAAAIINSRPLTPISADPNDLQPLTPFHFLTGAPISTFFEDSFDEVDDVHQLKLIYRSRFIFQKMWERYYKEYFSILQAQNKWYVQSQNVKIGDMVLLQMDNTDPLKWPIGRITAVRPDDLGNVRNVTVRTANNEYDRGIQRVALLPL